MGEMYWCKDYWCADVPCAPLYRFCVVQVYFVFIKSRWPNLYENKAFCNGLGDIVYSLIPRKILTWLTIINASRRRHPKRSHQGDSLFPM